MIPGSSLPLRKIKLGVYRHNKSGELYEVVGVALHSETGESLVIYRAKSYVPEYELFARPYAMFVEIIELHGVSTPRFEHIEKPRTHLA